MTSKLYSRTALANCLRRHKCSGKRIVFTNGCFDILHAGHIDYLSRAKRLGDFLVVGLNSDRSVRKLKGRGRPINSEKDRAAILNALEAVDYISIFDEETPLELICALKPEVLVKGADWPISKIAGAKEVQSWKGSVRRIKFLKGRSTSGILKKISSI